MKTMSMPPLSSKVFEGYRIASVDILRQLNEKCIAENIFDPLIYKQRMLLDQLHAISNDLKSAWNDETTTAKDKETLFRAMQLHYSLSTFLTTLNEENEKTFIALLDELNQLTGHYNDKVIQQMKTSFAAVKKHRTLIERLIFGETLSFSASYLGTTASVFAIIAFACEATLKEAIKYTGTIFNPIIAVATSVGKLFHFIENVGQVKTERQIALDDKYHLIKLKQAKKLLRGSNALKFTSFALNTITIFAFAGLLLSNPIGWGIVAIACAVDWIDTGLLGVKKAKLEYELARNAIDKAQRSGKPQDDAVWKNYNDKTAALKKAKSAERWGRINVLAAILFACAPIPIVGQVLMGIGLVTFGVVVARNVYVAVKPRYDQYKRNKYQKQKVFIDSSETTKNTDEHVFSKRPTHTSKATITTVDNKHTEEAKVHPWFLRPASKLTVNTEIKTAQHEIKIRRT